MSNMRKLLLLFFASVLLLVASALILQKKTKGFEPSGISSEKERLIIKFRPLVPKFYKENLFSSYGLAQTSELKLKDAVVVEIPKGLSAIVTGKLNKNLTVEYAEKDAIAYKVEVPNDPNFGSQWGLTKIKASEGWDVTHGSGSVDIAITDTGINSSHPDLTGKIVVSVNCTVSSSCPSQTTTDPDGHGTHVAGIASAITNNSEGVAGVSWEGKLMSVKVLDDTGSGYYSWIVNGIVWAADNGAEVINLSLGGSSSSSALKSAVDYAWGKGVVIVAAAGNSGNTRALYPAYYANSIAVAATDQNDKKASFSSYGSWVDVAAPGVSILSSYHGGYDYLSGTSMAAPHVTGLAALLFGQNPSWTNSQVRGRIESTSDAVPGTGLYWSKGRINVCRAVGGCGVSPSPSPSASPTSTPTATAIPTPTPTPSPSPTVTPSPSPTPTPSPSPSPKPWWCVYLPTSPRCQ